VTLLWGSSVCVWFVSGCTCFDQKLSTPPAMFNTSRGLTAGLDENIVFMQRYFTLFFDKN